MEFDIPYPIILIILAVVLLLVTSIRDIDPNKGLWYNLFVTIKKRKTPVRVFAVLLILCSVILFCTANECPLLNSKPTGDETVTLPEAPDRIPDYYNPSFVAKPGIKIVTKYEEFDSKEEAWQYRNEYIKNPQATFKVIRVRERDKKYIVTIQEMVNN